jgi:hypothetical protein
MISFIKQPVIISVIALAFLVSCVERYYPDDLYLKDGLLVISAHITNKPGNQTIEVSRSSHPESPTFNAELGCFILLIREDGESREFIASEQPGYYTAELDAAFLSTGMMFQIQVITQDDNEYHSDFDMIRPVPAIDSTIKSRTYSFQVRMNPKKGSAFISISPMTMKPMNISGGNLLKPTSFIIPKWKLLFTITAGRGGPSKGKIIQGSVILQMYFPQATIYPQRN